MSRDELVRRAKHALRDVFAERLRGLVLYGSEARGAARPDSDVDLLVLLSSPVRRREDLWACIHALYPLMLETERPIHARPVDITEYEDGICPLYRQVKREGIAV